jgi:hypothetical protein
MIFDFMLDGEFSVTEFWEFEDLVFGIGLLLMLVVVGFGAVGGLAALVRSAHIHCSRVFTGAASISGNSTGPAFTIAGGCSVGVLQGLVFDV